MTKTTYVAFAPDGTQLTRKTDRTYTHAVLLENDQGWGIAGFCGRLDLAEKKRAEHPGSVIAECTVLDADAAKASAPEVTEKTGDRPKLTVGTTVKRLLTETDLGYAEIVDKVLEEHPDARTTARSVASVASTLRKSGLVVPMRRNKKG